MARVLIVSGDSSYDMNLGFALTARSHDVEVAKTGSEGIDMGLHLHPELLLVDWMLVGPLDGLDVVEALGAVFPQSRAVMVSGFPWDGLRETAEERGVARFAEKSADMQEIISLIDAALEAPPTARRLRIGFARYDEKGHEHFVNAPLKEMFGAGGDSKDQGFLHKVLSFRSKNSLLGQRDKWIDLTQRDADAPEFRGYVRHLEDGSIGLLVVDKRDKKAEDLENHPLVRALTGVTEPAKVAGRILIIDENQLQARVAKSQIEGAGCRCHAAESLDRGLKMLQADPGVHTVLLDFHTAADFSAVPRMKEIRPNVKIVGICTAFRKNEFAAAGVNNFLVKPVIATTLFQMLGPKVAVP